MGNSSGTCSKCFGKKDKAPVVLPPPYDSARGNIRNDDRLSAHANANRRHVEMRNGGEIRVPSGRSNYSSHASVATRSPVASVGGLSKPPTPRDQTPPSSSYNLPRDIAYKSPHRSPADPHNRSKSPTPVPSDRSADRGFIMSPRTLAGNLMSPGRSRSVSPKKKTLSPTKLITGDSDKENRASGMPITGVNGAQKNGIEVNWLIP